MKQGKLNLLIDGQFGSTGKGLFAEFISRLQHVDIAVTNASPNAGHTFTWNGRLEVCRHLPVAGILQPRATIYLCAGAIIDPEIFREEVDRFGIAKERLWISPRAAVIQAHHRTAEADGQMVAIASTQHGVGEALADKTRRTLILAADTPELQPYVRPLSLQWYLDQVLTAIMEVPQGLGLSLNSGAAYPYCTSREITVSSALTDAQVHPTYLGTVIVTLRAHPIRVGNTENGFSGPFYEDSKELTWEELGVPEEYTTNTKRVRRIATFSHKQYQDMLGALKPDYIFLNFLNYLSKPQARQLLSKLPEVTHTGYGPTVDNIRLRF